MASPKIPWGRLWIRLWKLIPEPETNGRSLVALDDFINPKTGKKIFGCANIFDHAAKQNQSKYPWAQNVVTIGLLKMIKGRWACLPLSHRYYHLEKEIKKNHPKYNGKDVTFQSKHGQAVDMLCTFAAEFPESNILVVTDSWFGNNGMWKPLSQKLGDQVHMISRLRSNNNLFDEPPVLGKRKRGRPRKYGEKLGTASSLAGKYKAIEACSKELKRDIGSAKTQTRNSVAVTNHLEFCMMATTLTWVYACRLGKTPRRRHAVKGRGHFAFSDVRMAGLPW